MRLLLSNDDGYQALGIQTLARVLQEAGHDVTIVAPSGERSAQSHSMSFYMPVTVKKHNETLYDVSGTPADAVAIGLGSLLKNNPPDYVIAGINHGLNVGVDVNYSGTVGAATEAALMGYKAISVSADISHLPRSQEAEVFIRAAHTVMEILNNIHTIQKWPEFEVLNINIPSQQGYDIQVADCSQESLFVPNFEALYPETQKKLSIYFLGGTARVKSRPTSQDVSLIEHGVATLSFIRAKQSSSESNTCLNALAATLKN